MISLAKQIYRMYKPHIYNNRILNIDDDKQLQNTFSIGMHLNYVHLFIYARISFDRC